jgi:uncharacterized Fe-S cluster-containing MiaB family protein
MFINRVVEAIWAPESEEYAGHCRRARGMDARELFDAVATRRMEYVAYEGHRTRCNLLLTSGCSHRIRGAKLAGCSMCDYHSSNLEGWAQMRELLRKDPGLYARAVRASFEAVRPGRPAPAFCEQVTGNDCLDPVEFPPEVMRELFEGGGLFDGEPRCYLFEVLASNVTRQRVAEFSRSFGPGRVLFFDFGVEATGWLRRHWINKGCGDRAIVASIDVLHEAGHFAAADLLIGIPGLTEGLSLQTFLDTVRWLDGVGIDRVFCLPLNRKSKTLQGLLYERLRDNRRLTDLGICHGEHTGVPWLFTVVDAVCRAFEEVPSMRRSLRLAAVRSDQVVIENHLAYNADPDCPCNERTAAAFERYQRTGDPGALFAVRGAGLCGRCWDEYERLTEKQSRAGSLAENLLAVAEEVAKELFPGEWESRVDGFRKELRSLPVDGARLGRSDPPLRRAPSRAS